MGLGALIGRSLTRIHSYVSGMDLAMHNQARDLPNEQWTQNRWGAKSNDRLSTEANGMAVPLSRLGNSFARWPEANRLRRLRLLWKTALAHFF